MSANAIYAAHGRMRKVFVFDTNNYTLENNMSVRRFEPVCKVYEGLAGELNAVHPEAPVDLYVFFTVNPYGYETPPWYDKDRKIWFIPVNYKVPDTSVPTSWTQDVFSLINGQKIHYLQGENGMPEQLVNLLRFYAGCEMVPVSRFCEDGDLLRGINGDFRYVFKSWNEQEQVTNKWVAVEYNIPEEHVFCMQQPKSDMVGDRLLFHIDTSVTIAGNIGDNRELILIGKPYNEEWFDLNTVLDAFEDELKQWRWKNGKVKFETLRLPLIVINDKILNITHCLSYNNCLVENYVDNNGHRYINFYFPDFREEYDAYRFAVTAARRQTLKKLERMKRLGQVSLKLLKRNEHLIGMVNEDMIFKVEAEIRESLSSVLGNIKGITHTVRFIKHNFRNISDKRGSLRCMAKVVERDMMNG